MVYEMECQQAIEIVVNGERHAAPAGLTILKLLGDLNVDPARVAVELDRQIIKRSEWRERELVTGARLEIVQFVGGG